MRIKSYAVAAGKYIVNRIHRVRERKCVVFILLLFPAFAEKKRQRGERCELIATLWNVRWRNADKSFSIPAMMTAFRQPVMSVKMLPLKSGCDVVKRVSLSLSDVYSAGTTIWVDV